MFQLPETTGTGTNVLNVILTILSRCSHSRAIYIFLYPFTQRYVQNFFDFSVEEIPKSKMPHTLTYGTESAANKAIGGVPVIHYFDFQSRGRGQVVRLLLIVSFVSRLSFEGEVYNR